MDNFKELVMGCDGTCSSVDGRSGETENTIALLLTGVRGTTGQKRPRRILRFSQERMKALQNSIITESASGTPDQLFEDAQMVSEAIRRRGVAAVLTPQQMLMAMASMKFVMSSLPSLPVRTSSEVSQMNSLISMLESNQSIQPIVSTVLGTVVVPEKPVAGGSDPGMNAMEEDGPDDPGCSKFWSAGGSPKADCHTFLPCSSRSAKGIKAGICASRLYPIDTFFGPHPGCACWGITINDELVRWFMLLLILAIVFTFMTDGLAIGLAELAAEGLAGAITLSQFPAIP